MILNSLRLKLRKSRSPRLSIASRVFSTLFRCSLLPIGLPSARVSMLISLVTWPSRWPWSNRSHSKQKKKKEKKRKKNVYHGPALRVDNISPIHFFSRNTFTALFNHFNCLRFYPHYDRKNGNVALMHYTFLKPLGNLKKKKKHNQIGSPYCVAWFNLK